jgi:hypothetical protein
VKLSPDSRRLSSNEKGRLDRKRGRDESRAEVEKLLVTESPGWMRLPSEPKAYGERKSKKNSGVS